MNECNEQCLKKQYTFCDIFPEENTTKHSVPEFLLIQAESFLEIFFSDLIK